MKEKLTGWYPSGVAPVREGVYQVKGRGICWYRWIDTDGTQYVGDSSPARALLCVNETPVRMPPLFWRGLAEEPK